LPNICLFQLVQSLISQSKLPATNSNEVAANESLQNATIQLYDITTNVLGIQSAPSDRLQANDEQLTSNRRSISVQTDSPAVCKNVFILINYQPSFSNIQTYRMYHKKGVRF